jgi:paraquat-inducible protein B
MTKQVQILLSRPLTVNLGTDEHGRAITEKLNPGLQFVDQEVADNWFVKAHCQELTQEDVENGELQKQVEQLQGDLKALQEQSDKATATIDKLTEDLAGRDKTIADLNIQLTKAQQAATDTKPKEAAKAKEQPKET